MRRPPEVTLLPDGPDGPDQCPITERYRRSSGRRAGPAMLHFYRTDLGAWPQCVRHAKTALTYEITYTRGFCNFLDLWRGHIFSNARDIKFPFCRHAALPVGRVAIWSRVTSPPGARPSIQKTLSPPPDLPGASQLTPQQPPAHSGYQSSHQSPEGPSAAADTFSTYPSPGRWKGTAAPDTTGSHSTVTPGCHSKAHRQASDSHQSTFHR